LLFHHAREIDHVRFGVVRQERLSRLLGPEPTECLRSGELCPIDDWHEQALYMEPAYDWLAERIGFYPLFLAVGDHEDALRITGYADQFRRKHRPAGVRNRALFSFADLPEPLAFQDYDAWHFPLGGTMEIGTHRREVIVPPYWERAILKASWRRSDWLRRARRAPGSVQAAVPELDLRAADRIWCRNQATRGRLIAMGFAPERVEVRRLRVEPWW